MTEREFPARVLASIVPPSIADKRGRAFGETMARAIADPDFRKLLFERIDTVDASVLPFLVRDFSIEEFVEPGMSEAVVRRLLKGSYDLHASKGFISGVRRGLLMLGMRVVWKQWFKATPKGQPGTHVATVFVNQTIFDDQETLIDERSQRAALRMIEGMKRYSQDVSFQIGVATTSRAGAASAAHPMIVAPIAASIAPPEIGARIGSAAAAGMLAVSRMAGKASPWSSRRSALATASAARAIQFINIKAEARTV